MEKLRFVVRNKMRAKSILFYGLTVTLLLSSLSLAARGQSGATTANTAEAADIRLRGADGKSYDLGGMRGRVLLVSFGATWCQPCKEELKALEQLKKEYKDKPVQFLWVSIETEDEVSNSALKDYAKKLSLSFPVLRDPDRSTFMRFSPRMRLPTTLFFNRDGKLSAPNQVGMAELKLYLSTIRARLDRLLATEAATGGN